MTNLYHQSGLVWNDEKGIGYLMPKGDGIYDHAYFEQYVERASTPIGKLLNEARVALVKKWTGSSDVVDIGIGAGTFIESRGPGTFGYDVNPSGIRWLLDRELWWDPYQKDPPNVTYWDSLEHMCRPEVLLAFVKFHAFVSIPIFTDLDHILSSKHFKPNQHIFYFTRNGFVRFFEDAGFRLLEENKMESELGREDISTFVFRRNT
jgi:hypothetical protein